VATVLDERRFELDRVDVIEMLELLDVPMTDSELPDI